MTVAGAVLHGGGEEAAGLPAGGAQGEALPQHLPRRPLAHHLARGVDAVLREVGHHRVHLVEALHHAGDEVDRAVCRDVVDQPPLVAVRLLARSKEPLEGVGGAGLVGHAAERLESCHEQRRCDVHELLRRVARVVGHSRVDVVRVGYHFPQLEVVRREDDGVHGADGLLTGLCHEIRVGHAEHDVPLIHAHLVVLVLVAGLAVVDPLLHRLRRAAHVHVRHLPLQRGKRHRVEWR
mmetsp:Transcript_76524/g.213925  ORF Transcript_76524/g.213925 Transcript_76524/m.213925 type:complete len:236 (+) Transcript_76524:2645-3352(+)